MVGWVVGVWGLAWALHYCVALHFLAATASCCWCRFAVLLLLHVMLLAPCPTAAHLLPSARSAALQFIYISLEEMTAVAEFIRQRGRIAISELAAKSSQFIDLEPKATEGAELELPAAEAAGA